MATAQTSRWVSTAPYVKLTVTQKSSNEGSAVYTYTFQYIASSAASVSSARPYKIKVGSMVKEDTFSINGKTGTHTIESGEVTIKRGTSSKEITVYCSFEFDLTWSGSYAGTKTASDSFTLAAKTSYTVTFNANGGTGGPSKQTKWFGDDLTLASGVPTRSGYTFMGWATSSGGAVAYAPASKYTSNSGITLYAVWHLDYAKPVISNLTVSRCTSDGTVSDSGTYALVKFNWSSEKTVTSIKADWESRTNSTDKGSANLSGSGTSGSVSQVVGNGAINSESAYLFTITVADSGGSSADTRIVNGQIFPIDFLAGGKGVAIGKKAEIEDFLEVAFYTYFSKPFEVAGGFSFNDWYKPSAIRLYKTASTTSLDTAYKYYNPLYGSVATDIQKGNMTYTTKTIATYGDRSNESVAGVLVGKNISRVRVSATICIQNQANSTSLLQLILLKVSGSTVTMEASDRFRILETEIRTMTIDTILSVSEGDFICLMGYKGVAGIDIDILATSNSVSKISQLCVEAIG